MSGNCPNPHSPLKAITQPVEEYNFINENNVLAQDALPSLPILKESS